MMKLWSLLAFMLVGFTTKNAYAQDPLVDYLEQGFYQILLQCDNIMNNTCFEPTDLRGKIITDFTEVMIVMVSRGTLIPTNIQRRLGAGNLRGMAELSTEHTVTDLEEFLAQARNLDFGKEMQGERHLLCGNVNCAQNPRICAMYGCDRRRRHLQASEPVIAAMAYDKNPHQMCRRANGDPGVDGDEFTWKGENHTAAWCENECDIRDDCYAYEYMDDHGKCNLWHEVPPTLQTHHPANCNIKKKAAYKYHDGNYCRTEANQGGSHGVEYDQNNNVATIEECEDMCTVDPACKGYEYKPGTLSCELWQVTPAKFHATTTNSYCNVKVLGVVTETHQLKDLLASFPLTNDENDCLTNVQCKISWMN